MKALLGLCGREVLCVAYTERDGTIRSISYSGHSRSAG